jgi:threonine dehydrogenase-like Zn-dependent dehydrogenase
MRALTFVGVEKVTVETVPDPAILGPRDAIVKVLRAGICGSDLHVYFGRESGLDAGTVLGHEMVGEIVDLGSAVRNFTRGDIVFCPFSTNCGECFYCRRGLTSRCSAGQLFGWVEGGKGLHGAQAEYARVPLADTSLLKIPEGVTSDEALFLGDILSTGYFCADMAAIEREGCYAVIGCGPVGIMTVISARELGAGRVFAIDLDDHRLQIAERFGAIPLNPVRCDVIATVREATSGRGADSVMEAVGSPEAGRLAYGLVRPCGIISVCGVHNEERFAFSPADAYNKNITFRIGRCPARHYMEKLLPLVRSKKYDFSSLISHRLPLAEAAEGYRLFAGRHDNCSKVVLEVGSAAARC